MMRPDELSRGFPLLRGQRFRSFISADAPDAVCEHVYLTTSGYILDLDRSSDRVFATLEQPFFEARIDQLRAAVRRGRYGR